MAYLRKTVRPLYDKYISQFPRLDQLCRVNSPSITYANIHHSKTKYVVYVTKTLPDIQLRIYRHTYMYIILTMHPHVLFSHLNFETGIKAYIYYNTYNIYKKMLSTLPTL